MHDVIVVDEEFHSAAGAILMACEQLQLILRRYQSIMLKAASEGTVSGEAAQALSAYVRSARALSKQLAAVRNAYSEAAESFLRGIDAMDSYLY